MIPNWFGVWVMTGKEQSLLPKIQSAPGIKQALLPMDAIWQLKGGKWSQSQQVLIPSYIFVRCAMITTTYYAIKDIPGVIGWLGKDTYWPGTIPDGQMTPLLDIMGGADPKGLLTNVTLSKRQRRGYGYLTIGGVDHKIPFNTYHDKQAEDTEG